MAAILNREFWTEFIELYKNLPELWETKNVLYRDRLAKKAGYEVLADKLRELDQTANRHTVTRKINSLRGCYRRELRKLHQSERTATCPEEVYKPTLWYFDNLNFILEHMDSNEESSLNNDDSTTTMDNIDLPENDYSDFEYISIKDKDKWDQKEFEKITIEKLPTIAATPKRIKAICLPTPPPTQQQNIVNNKLFTTQSTIEAGFDVCLEYGNLLGKCWSTEFNKLTPEQRLHAKRAIDEVLYQGRLGKLTEESTRINVRRKKRNFNNEDYQESDDNEMYNDTDINESKRLILRS